MTGARGLARYTLDLVGVQQVKWDKGGTIGAEEYNFFYGQGNEIQQLETGLLVHHRIDTADKGVEFVSAWMTEVVLRGHRCNTFFSMCMHESEEKNDYSKDCFYEELDYIFLTFS
jgi:hypothetical protein